MLVVDDSAFAEAKLLHPTAEGFFTVAQKHAPDHRGKEWSERTYASSSLQQVLGAVQNVPDFYISQASFVTRRRGNASVGTLAGSFVDLDCYKLGILPDEATVQALLAQATKFGLPLPSYVMSSGRGLYAKWIFDQPLGGALIPHWGRLQQVLGHVFLSFGSDANARDMARVLRASSTLNSKSGENVRVIYQSGTTHRFVDLAAIAAQIDISGMITTSKEKARQIRIKQESLVAIPSDLGALVDYAASREPVMMKQFSKQSLNWTRFTDLRNLMIRRGGAASGSRDVFLFWMTASLASSGVIGAQNFWGEVQNLLRGFPVSQDFNPMAEGSLETLRRRIEAHGRGEKIEFKGSRVSPIYTPTNDYLINVLNITDEEQQQLQTIISGCEKQRRRDLTVPGRAERREQRTEIRAVAAQMAANGKSNAAIAAELGVTVATVGKWFKSEAAKKEAGKPSVLRAEVREKWDAEAIAKWAQARKDNMAQRQREYEQLQEQQKHLEAARVAQTELKINSKLMVIYDRIMAARAEPEVKESFIEQASHPLDPPKPVFEIHADEDAFEDDIYLDDEPQEYDRPRF
jgi:predicted transcriptional regulator